MKILRRQLLFILLTIFYSGVGAANGSNALARPNCTVLLGGLKTISEAVEAGELPDFYLNGLAGPFKAETRNGYSVWDSGIYRPTNVDFIGPYAGDAPIYFTNDLTASMYTVSTKGYELLGPFSPAQRALMRLDFLQSKANTLIVGSSGFGKTFLLYSVAVYALVRGHTVGVLSLNNGLPIVDSLKPDNPEDPSRLVGGKPEYSLEAYRDVEILIVDNFSQNSEPDGFADRLEAVLNYRAMRDLPTIVTLRTYGRNVENTIPEALQGARVDMSVKLLFLLKYEMINKNRFFPLAPNYLR